MIYKAPNNDTCIADVCPDGWVEITREQHEAILQSRQVAVDQKDTIRAQIDALERVQLMPRATREFMLLMMESQFPAESLAANPGYSAVKAFDNEIKALRDQL